MSKRLEMRSKLFGYHDFEKVNLVGDEKGCDTYKCKKCGLVGKRPAFSETMQLVRPYADKLNVCDGSRPKFNKANLRKQEEKVFVSQTVVITNGRELEQFGFSKDEKHQTVACPKNQNPELVGVWIHSDVRNEPVRLLEHEYKIAPGEESNG